MNTRDHNPTPRTGLGATRLAVTLPNPSAAEPVAILDVLDQLVAQIWEHHGDPIVDFMLRSRRHREELGVSSDLPF